jgi:hypothetical protein
MRTTKHTSLVQDLIWLSWSLVRDHITQNMTGQACAITWRGAVFHCMAACVEDVSCVMEAGEYVGFAVCMRDGLFFLGNERVAALLDLSEWLPRSGRCMHGAQGQAARGSPWGLAKVDDACRSSGKRNASESYGTRGIAWRGLERWDGLTERGATRAAHQGRRRWPEQAADGSPAKGAGPDRHTGSGTQGLCPVRCFRCAWQ